jgi:hypothetical protein
LLAPASWQGHLGAAASLACCAVDCTTRQRVCTECCHLICSYIAHTQQAPAPPFFAYLHPSVQLHHSHPISRLMNRTKWNASPAAQVHYNNPLHLPLTDSSGFKLFHTSQLRRYDVGVLTLGQPELDIPAGSPAYKALPNICPASCTSQFPTNLTVLYTAPHMHNIGKALTTQRLRGGVELSPLSQRRCGVCLAASCLCGSPHAWHQHRRALVGVSGR